MSTSGHPGRGPCLERPLPARHSPAVPAPGAGMVPVGESHVIAPARVGRVAALRSPPDRVIGPRRRDVDHFEHEADSSRCRRARRLVRAGGLELCAADRPREHSTVADGGRAAVARRARSASRADRPVGAHGRPECRAGDGAPSRSAGDAGQGACRRPRAHRAPGGSARRRAAGSRRGRRGEREADRSARPAEAAPGTRGERLRCTRPSGLVGRDRVDDHGSASGRPRRRRLRS